MFAALFANGGPAFYPLSASSSGEWVFWGCCMSLAAVLGGWGLVNRNRPSRDTLVGAALLIAFALVGAATLNSMTRSHARQMEQNRREREQREQEDREQRIEPPR